MLVPTVRLELTRLTPLPPQDSVSTNFTTSARFNLRQILRRARDSLAVRFARGLLTLELRPASMFHLARALFQSQELLPSRASPAPRPA